MAKIDKIKEFIGFLKALFIIAVVIMTSLVSYLYSKSIADNYLVIAMLVVDFVIIILLFKKIIKEINRLEDL